MCHVDRFAVIPLSSRSSPPASCGGSPSRCPSSSWTGSPGGWLTVVRFALAAPLLAFVARRNLRAAITPRILFAGAIGYGLVIVLQNAGIESTSVSHAALIVGAVPALVALIAAATGRELDRPGGLARLRARARGRRDRGRRRRRRRVARRRRARAAVRRRCRRRSWSSSRRCCAGRDPIAVTAVQMIAGGLAAVPNAALEGLPPAPASRRAGDRAGRAGDRPARCVPFALFAYGQSRVAPELAGAFLNLEPLVGTAAGALAFGDPFGPLQLAGGAVILLGIALSTTPRGAAPRTPKVALRTTRRQSAPSDERGHGGRLRPCSTPVSIRSTSPPPPRPTASARAAEP